MFYILIRIKSVKGQDHKMYLQLYLMENTSVPCPLILGPTWNLTENFVDIKL
jgi:hypothetical protein